RVDHQVKVRGLRIDLGDIETALRQHFIVREAVVMSRESLLGDQRLVAYVAPKQPCLPQALGTELRCFLCDRLPRYMVPTEYVVVDQMPLNPNGKIDRQALASLGRA
ncbi:MAG TPA: non-ribosomal peptide synthetase, partial [Methylomirabilota bacterium]|nr:non-ribosomal peptide synthetase [Methylomirabilota bacterium]